MVTAPSGGQHRPRRMLSRPERAEQAVICRASDRQSAHSHLSRSRRRSPPHIEHLGRKPDDRRAQVRIRVITTRPPKSTQVRAQRRLHPRDRVADTHTQRLIVGRTAPGGPPPPAVPITPISGGGSCPPRRARLLRSPGEYAERQFHSAFAISGPRGVASDCCSDTVRDGEVPGSNPGAPITRSPLLAAGFGVFQAHPRP